MRYSLCILLERPGAKGLWMWEVGLICLPCRCLWHLCAHGRCKMVQSLCPKKSSSVGKQTRQFCTLGVGSRSQEYGGGSEKVLVSSER